jgi:hypothetical protein
MTIEFEQWFEKYQPVRNKLNPNGCYMGYMYDTHGKDAIHLIDSKIPNHQLWTLVDCDNEEQYIIPGWHVVNRAGHFITKYPWIEEDLEVNLNEMITTGKAKYLCIEFMTDVLGLPEDLFEDKIHDWFSQNT